MSALSKFSTMKRPLGGVAGALGCGGAGVGAGFTGAAGGGAVASLGRGPTETGGSGEVGSVWMVTVGGGGTGPSGGVAIFGAGFPFVVQPAMSESTRVLAMTPLSLLLRRIAHTRWHTAQQVRWKRTSTRNHRRRRREGRLAGHDGRRQLTRLQRRRLRHLRRRRRWWNYAGQHRRDTRLRHPGDGGR